MKDSKEPDGVSLLHIPLAHSTATLERLAQYGVEQEHFKRIRNDNAFLIDVASVLKGQAIIFEKMFHRNFEGVHHFFGVGAYWHYFKIKLWEVPCKVPEISKKLLKILQEPCPFGDSDKKVYQTHVLFLGLFNPDHTLVDIEWIDCIATDNWYFKWVLMPRFPILRTRTMDWETILQKMPNNYVIASEDYISLLESINCKIIPNYFIENPLIKEVRIARHTTISFKKESDYVRSVVHDVDKDYLLRTFVPIRAYRKV